MIYPENFENKIGFDKVRNLIKSRCIGNCGKQIVDELSFSNDINYLRAELAKTGEMIDICLLKDDFPGISYQDTSYIIKKMQADNSCLQTHEFVDVRTILETTKSIRHFFKKYNKEKYPILSEIILRIVFPDFVLDRINSSFTRSGEVKDNASVRLKEIRSQLLSSNKNVLKSLDRILNNIRSNGWIDSDLSATLINGRLVLPIDSSHKRKIKGLIHDESASGKTSYIEPQEVVELNNTIRELELEENREILKILFELTNDIRPYSENLRDISDVIGELDFLRAKSLFAISIDAIIPALDEKPGVDLIRGRHPLLYLSFKNDKKDVVPTNVKIDSENRIVVISGPNAGGKSVALKTVGLLSYMVQCAIPISVGGTSVFGIFDKIFVDLGDDQSIDNDLSTYSSHLTKMKYFLKNADDKTLILIDEFGSGTDPLIGGTMAEAILQELNKHNCQGVITTHYSNLKIFASNTVGVQNAAMLIDSNKMQPLFILEQGFPGSSYALEIASRIGLPENIIENIKLKAGPEQTDFDKFMRKVLKDKRYWERKRQSIRQKEKKLEETIERHTLELETLMFKRKKIVEETKQESQKILNSVNKKIENTIREIRENQADKEKTAELRKDVDIFKDNIQSKIESEDTQLDSKYYELKRKQEERANKRQEKKPEIVKIDKNELHIGSKARIKGQTTIGYITDITEKNVVICFGNIYTSIARDRVEKVSKDEVKKSVKTKSNNQFDFNDKLLNFKPYIDVRGSRVEEVIKTITDFIDEAVMLNCLELKILHGKGDGILRQHIREYLKTFSCVKSLENEDVRYGGDGITIVKLR